MIFSKKLSPFKEISHGFTTREEKWSADDLVLAEQIHGTTIGLVGRSNIGQKMKGMDGLITNEPQVKIGVRTADCVSILFFEPVKKIIAAVHAGWRGTLDRIAQKTVEEIKKMGGSPLNLLAAIGPHIGLCCYDIEEKRAKAFEEKFGPDPKMISFFDGKPHLDLAYINFLALLKAGVARENMDIPISCTSCQKDLFFSYRRSKKEGDRFGEMLSLIGLI